MPGTGNVGIPCSWIFLNGVLEVSGISRNREFRNSLFQNVPECSGKFLNFQIVPVESQEFGEGPRPGLAHET